MKNLLINPALLAAFARKSIHIHLALAALMSISSARAGTHTWSGAANGYWSVAANWSSGGAPTNGESPLTLIFAPGAMRYNTTNDVAGLNLDSLTLSGFFYTLYGQPGKTLTLKGGTSILCTDLNTLDSSLGLVLINTNYVSVATNKLLTIQSPISGTGSLAKVGPGELDFTGTSANSYTGPTLALDGTLVLQRGASSNSPALAVAGPLIVGANNNGLASAALKFPQQIVNNGSVTIYNSGIL